VGVYERGKGYAVEFFPFGNGKKDERNWFATAVFHPFQIDFKK